MAATFLQAMIAAYGALANSNPTLPVKLWTEQVPDEETTYPRSELMIADGATVLDKLGPQMQSVKANLTVYHTSLTAAEAVFLIINDQNAGLTPTSLTIDNTKNRLWRTNYIPGAIARERTSDQRPIYAAMNEYLCEIDKG